MGDWPLARTSQSIKHPVGIHGTGASYQLKHSRVLNGISVGKTALEIDILFAGKLPQKQALTYSVVYRAEHPIRVLVLGDSYSRLLIL